jgi:hypothetical protein
LPLNIFLGKLKKYKNQFFLSGKSSSRKCGVHAYRFSGCRIFCCKGKVTFQSELTEAAIKKFKALCAELQIPYRYLELPAALKEAQKGA